MMQLIVAAEWSRVGVPQKSSNPRLHAWLAPAGVTLVAALTVTCGDGGSDRRIRSLIPSMAELECEAFDGTNSTGLRRETPGAPTIEDAVRAFGAEGFLDLDERRGELRVVRRSQSTAPAEYRVEGSNRAVLLLTRTGQWRVDSVAWCSSVERGR